MLQELNDRLDRMSRVPTSFDSRRPPLIFGMTGKRQASEYRRLFLLAGPVLYDLPIEIQEIFALQKQIFLLLTSPSQTKVYDFALTYNILHVSGRLV